MKLMQAHHQWASRPTDERFTSLHTMLDQMRSIKDNSRERSTVLRNVLVAPSSNGDLLVGSKTADPSVPLTNWSFGQLASLAGAPAGYLRKLPAPMAADCLNYGMQFGDDASKEVSALFTRRESVEARAFNGARYGRIWNADIVHTLVDRFGDGVSGEWRVPGVWGKRVDVTNENTTLYASDRDMFVFLCNEENRIEVPNRRNGETGTLARGFFVWNSEVGSKTLGIATFLFDEVCQNRIVWGATQYKEVKMRHSLNAPDRWAGELQPMLRAYANATATVEAERVKSAQAKRLDDVDKFLSTRFGPRMVDRFKSVHMLEEHRPIETLWDVTTAVTAYARNIVHQDERVDMERKAGDILELAA